MSRKRENGLRTIKPPRFKKKLHNNSMTRIYYRLGVSFEVIDSNKNLKVAVGTASLIKKQKHLSSSKIIEEIKKQFPNMFEDNSNLEIVILNVNKLY